MWRRDPTLFYRTPIRRSTDSILHTFSTSKPRYARYSDESDNNNGKRPDAMSDQEHLEWLRQRYLRRWRKRIEEDPYRALFGASEDMLSGKGLEGYLARQAEIHKKGIEWVNKRFPKWMREDMGLRDPDEFEIKEEKKAKDGSGYPKKVNFEGNTEVKSKERDDSLPGRSSRHGRFEGESWNKGIESPSDSRRPREQPISPFQDSSELHKDIVQGIRKGMQAPEMPTPVERNPTHEPVLEPTSTTLSGTQATADATARESTFIEEFLADKTPLGPPTRSERTDGKDWRQTALERRVASSPTIKPRRNTSVPVVDVSAKDKARAEKSTGLEQVARLVVRNHGSGQSGSDKAVLYFHGPPGSRVGMSDVENFASKVVEQGVELKAGENLTSVAETTDEAGGAPPPQGHFPRINTDDWIVDTTRGSPKQIDELDDAARQATVKDINNVNFGQKKPDAPVVPRRSTSDVLQQLPKDDLDFLTADDIRASMGRTKGVREDKNIIRQKLEEEYQKETPELDPMLEAQVVNNQYMRRKAGEMVQAQEKPNPIVSKPAADVAEQDTAAFEDKVDTKPVSVLETGLDFMSRWLHTGGNVLAQHFWQDPVRLVAGQLSGAEEEFFKGIGSGVLKGRRTFALIKDELIEDIPACKELVNRLNRDEIKASAGAVRLYRELPSALKDTFDAAASKAAAHARIGKLRQALLDTDKQFKEACDLVDNMKTDTKPSFLLQKRLIFAADVLRKNAKLTRMAVFGLQGRIEVATASDGLIFRELLHRLLTLQDTQLALSRLVSRAMQVLGVNPNAQTSATKTDELTADLADQSVAEALASAAAKDDPVKQDIDHQAVNEKLEEEVSKQKDAMRGLSDDGYKHPPKPFIWKSFDGPNPLAHSLFRPFGLQLDSLGKKVDAEKEGETTAAKKGRGDRELVKEVKKAYEDVYGAITVDHRQITPEEERTVVAEEVTKVSDTKEPKRQASIQMLKEDEVSPSVTNKGSITDTTSESKPKGNVAAEETVSEVYSAADADKVNPPAAVEIVQSFDEVNKKGNAEGERLPTEASGLPTADLKNAQDLPSPPDVPQEGARLPAFLHYTTLIYNAETDKLSVTTSQVPIDKPPTSPIPLHEALATLTHPAKFVDHLPEAFHIIAVKPDVLTVEEASPSSSTAVRFSTTSLGNKDAEHPLEAEETDGWKGINPVDGTTTLSPTGFEGVGSDLERDHLEFQERRRKADEYNREINEVRRNFEAAKQPYDADGKKRKGRVGFGGVVKSAIWAGAVCYVIGIMAELAKSPF
ncbi:hypothetical protein BU23DRAFT_548416 [Bimuria novae-zelandiae CBS 107.79]|uniref:Uncharacterized protein n=1 Tax=Bimuria novae-zelandiae CBS 107.79 TaxID=1447943 RepID=A0A6A5VUH9_9PLEO|nr:hypothetical protein BU23DRAFT_548416 [Bimuria novae-zelandiae CBS 107.79]